MVGADCPPDERYFSRIQEYAQKYNTTIKDENGTSFNGTVYYWNVDVIPDMIKTTNLRIAVFNISKNVSKVAFWIEGKVVSQ
jgi:hypothetical protein